MHSLFRPSTTSPPPSGRVGTLWRPALDRRSKPRVRAARNSTSCGRSGCRTRPIGFAGWRRRSPTREWRCGPPAWRYASGSSATRPSARSTTPPPQRSSWIAPCVRSRRGWPARSPSVPSGSRPRLRPPRAHPRIGRLSSTFPHCNVPRISRGQRSLQSGNVGAELVFGELLAVANLAVHVYACPTCGSLELFLAGAVAHPVAATAELRPAADGAFGRHEELERRDLLEGLAEQVGPDAGAEVDVEEAAPGDRVDADGDRGSGDRGRAALGVVAGRPLDRGLQDHRSNHRPGAEPEQVEGRLVAPQVDVAVPASGGLAGHGDVAAAGVDAVEVSGSEPLEGTGVGVVHAMVFGRPGRGRIPLRR